MPATLARATGIMMMAAGLLACAEAERAPAPRAHGGSAGASRSGADVAGADELASMATPTGLRCVADASKPQRANYAKPGAYPVATLELTLEDTSRPIPKTNEHPAAPARKLVTTVYYPASGTAPLFGDALVAKGGPFPMLMYSHGFSSTRSEASAIGTLAASHGYVVVAPDFPLSNLLANDGNPVPSDAPNQAGDVSFLIDQMIELSQQSGHVLANAVDAARIGATGVSMGGLTTLLVSLHPKLTDARIRAAAPIAALSSFFLPGFYHTRELPLLFVHGDNDAFIDYELNSRAAWEHAQPNAWLMTIAGGTHTAFAFALDPGTLAFVNLLLGLPGTDLSNADGLGCGAVGAQLEGRVPTFPASLGGAQNFIDEAQVGDSLKACAGTHHTKPALEAREQTQLTAAAVVAFFEAQLGKTAETREDACRYLVHVVPDHPAVALE
jgi:dienelactone hydrolase